MKLLTTLFAAGVALAAVGAAGLTADPAEARPRIHLQTPGFGLYIGPRYHHRHYRHHYYQPYYHRPYYRPYYRGHYYRPYRRSYGGCGHWAKRCAANWGWRNNDWRGCMKYHGCR